MMSKIALTEAPSEASPWGPKVEFEFETKDDD
jgi:hypothetical protein